jgi:hypothetical protein
MDTNNITSSDGNQEKSIEVFGLPANVRKEDPNINSSSSGIITSGIALRKKFIYEERDSHIEEYGEIPSRFEMELFAQEAKKKYPQDGDYRVIDGAATYLGIG